MKRLCKGKYIEYIDGKYVNKEFEHGIFHQFGVNYEELSCGVGHWTTAIVELEDGKIVTPAADMIQFINVNESEWHDESIKPNVHEWVVVRDADGMEYTDHQWVGHAWYDYCRGMDGTYDGWRTDVDVVSWRYQEE